MIYNDEVYDCLQILRDHLTLILDKLNIEWSNCEVYGWPNTYNMISLAIKVNDKFLGLHRIGLSELFDCNHKDLFKQIKPELEQIREEQLILKLADIK